MKTTAAPESWTIPEALAVAYAEFTQRFGVELLWQAFEALTTKPAATLQEHQELADELDQYLGHALNAQGADLVIWMANAKSRPDNAALLLHCGVRWWRARDALANQPKGSRVPCVYAEGITEHVALQLLSQLLYRGSAPDTVPGAGGPAPRTRE